MSVEFATGDYEGKHFVGSAKSKDTVNNYGDNLFIDGGEGADTIYTEGRGVTVNGGKDNDLFIHDGGDGNGSDVVLNSGTGSVTIKDAVGKKVTVIEDGKSTTKIFSYDGQVNSAGTYIQLTSSTQSFSADSKLVTIDGSLTNGATISGNDKANKIYAGDFDSTLNGGKGSDMLRGGAGSDTLIYGSNDGKDVIIGFGTEDLLEIGADFKASLKNNSVVFKVGTTSNAITLKDFSDTEFIANGDTYQLNGSTFTKK